jgi:putative transcriptional regulator
MYHVRNRAFLVSLNENLRGSFAMLVTESLSTAALVKETRKRLGLTQLQFAQTMGVSFQSVNCWEWGRTKPLPIVLKQIEVMVKEMGDKPNGILR